MPIVGLLILLSQVYFVVHAVRHGRQNWVFIIVIVPVVGCLAYFFAEMLPDLQAGPSGRKAAAQLKKALNPTGDLRRLQENLARTDSVANRVALADYLVQNGRFQEAILLYERSLDGNFAQDASVLAGLCQAAFHLEQYDRFLEYHRRLKNAKGDKTPQDVDLLAARALEEMNQTEAALAEYQALVSRFSGEEARFRHALLLKRTGQEGQARTIFSTIVSEAALAPRYYQKEQKPFIEAARAELKS